jgi:hypothetical protein
MTENAAARRRIDEDRGSKIEDRVMIFDAISYPRSSIFDPLGGSFYISGSDPVEADSRLTPEPPSPSGVEELDAVYGPIVAAQINGARLATGGDSMPDVDFFTAAVGVMNDHVVKLNRRAVDSDLDSLEPAAPAAHGNPVAIHPSIHIGLS